jgi:hypothetical protein
MSEGIQRRRPFLFVATAILGVLVSSAWGLHFMRSAELQRTIERKNREHGIAERLRSAGFEVDWQEGLMVVKCLYQDSDVDKAIDEVAKLPDRSELRLLETNLSDSNLDRIASIPQIEEVEVLFIASTGEARRLAEIRWEEIEKRLAGKVVSIGQNLRSDFERRFPKKDKN